MSTRVIGHGHDLSQGFCSPDLDGQPSDEIQWCMSFWAEFGPGGQRKYQPKPSL
jgi:hypothetical protein